MVPKRYIPPFGTELSTHQQERDGYRHDSKDNDQVKDEDLHDSEVMLNYLAVGRS